MEKIKIKEAIVVEGRYDVHAVSACFDTQIIELKGMGIYNNRPLQKLIGTLAETCGIIILTDSDHAGFMLRTRTKQCCASRGGRVLDAYVPDIPGKERRKSRPGAEGLLGVEGVGRENIIKAVLASGASVCGEDDPAAEPFLTREWLFELGLYGRADSSEKRRRLCEKIGLPGNISVTGLVGAINSMMSEREFLEALSETEIRK